MTHRSTDRPARRRSPRGLASIDSSGDLDDYVVVASKPAAPSCSGSRAGEADGSGTGGESGDAPADSSLQEQLAVVVVILELLILSLRVLLQLFELVTTYLIPLLRSIRMVARMTLGISHGEA